LGFTQALGKSLPILHIENDPEMRHGKVLAVDAIVNFRNGKSIFLEMYSDLMTNKSKSIQSAELRPSGAAQDFG
jgi:hypothetical protein